MNNWLFIFFNFCESNKNKNETINNILQITKIVNGNWLFFKLGFDSNNIARYFLLLFYVGIYYIYHILIKKSIDIYKKYTFY